MPFMQVSASSDAYISKSNPNRNFGMVTCLFTGVCTLDDDIFRSLLKFNLANCIPSGNNIINASLKLFVYIKNTPNRVLSPQAVNVFTNVSNFSENRVTWNNAPRLDSTPYFVNIIDGDVGNFVSIDITNLVIGWSDGTIPNNGITLVGIERKIIL